MSIRVSTSLFESLYGLSVDPTTPPQPYLGLRGPGTVRERIPVCPGRDPVDGAGLPDLGTGQEVRGKFVRSEHVVLGRLTGRSVVGPRGPWSVAGGVTPEPYVSGRRGLREGVLYDRSRPDRPGLNPRTERASPEERVGRGSRGQRKKVRSTCETPLQEVGDVERTSLTLKTRRPGRRVRVVLRVVRPTSSPVTLSVPSGSLRSSVAERALPGPKET